MRSTRQLHRYWHTIRYLRASQVVSRVDLRARALLRRLAPGAARSRYAARATRAGLLVEADPWRLRGAGPRASAWMTPEAREHLDRRAGEAAIGSFTFLNRSAHLGLPIDWQTPGQSQLWRYHLHYFDYLPELVVAGVEWPVAEALMRDWIARNPLASPLARDAWHPYVVSLRIVNWMLALAAAPSGTSPAADLLDSLRLQTVYLARNLETDVGGNHLLENFKALALAGCFWGGPGADALLDRFVPAFTRELESQLRSDGGHYEQSPMYHVRVLGDLVEVCAGLRLRGRPVSAGLEALASRMDAFLADVCHPDGEFAQFGDSAFGETPAPRTLHAAVALALGTPAPPDLPARLALVAAGFTDGAPPNVPPAAPAPRPVPVEWNASGSGFVRLATNDRRLFLVADAGPVCPDDLPGHAHSDALGFELSVDGLRMIVDTGVSEYEAGPWREYERSTRAHNTVVVDGAEQSDCWGSFRVAERAHIVAGRVVDRPGLRAFEAAHDGYERLASPVRHTRRVALVAERLWLVVDELTGVGTHGWETFLHWHPDVRLDAAGEGRWLATHGSTPLAVVGFGLSGGRVLRGEREPLQGWYAPGFGRRLAAPTLVAGGSGRLPAVFGWLLVPHARPDETASVEVRADGSVVATVGETSCELRRL